ncbi:MAG: organomercurial lyase [Gammaproteobacteria bacterium]
MQAETLNSLLRLFPPLDRKAQQISLSLYRLLAGGAPVSRKQLAEAAGMPETEVTQVLAQWPGLYYDQRGSVIAYWGLTIRPMTHRLRFNGRTVYAWCAWDTLFLPELLGLNVEIESACPVNKTLIRLSVTPQGISRCEPDGAVISLVTPTAVQVQENVVTHFCHYVHYFASPAAGAEWVARNPGTFILPIAEAHALGRQKNAVQYPDALFHSSNIPSNRS